MPKLTLPNITLTELLKEGLRHYKEKNYSEAFDIWLPLAKDKKLAEACHNIAVMYSLGQGTDQNYGKAKKYFELAGKRGCMKSKHNYAVILEKIDGNKKVAFQWYKKAAKKGVLQAQCRLGQIYADGDKSWGVGKNIFKSRKWLKKAADNGSAEAEYEISEIYYYGKNCEQDLVEARYWALSAAKKGHKKAQHRIADMNYEGEGAEKEDYETAKYWWEMAAEQGDLSAMSELGYLYITGQGVNKDEKEAFKWFLKAAEAGHAESQAYIGIMYRGGHGVKQDDKESSLWLYRSAMQGDAQAAYYISEVYKEGNILCSSYSGRALKFCIKSADAGFALAQLKLARLYSQIKSPKREKLAIHYYTLAATNQGSGEVSEEARKEAKKELNEKYPGKYIPAPEQKKKQPSLFEKCLDEYNNPHYYFVKDDSYLRIVFKNIGFSCLIPIDRIFYNIFDKISGTSFGKIFTKVYYYFYRRRNLNWGYKYTSIAVYYMAFIIPPLICFILIITPIILYDYTPTILDYISSTLTNLL